MAARVVGRSAFQRWIRGVLISGYVAFFVLGLLTDRLPLVFWTILLPLLPLSIVLMGFPYWRQVCPLAAFGDLGRLLNRGQQRRAPEWLQRWFFVATFGVLLSMLLLRLVATNGDPLWLSGLLGGAALAALLVNLVFTGKTWCNFLCPVSLIERIYTEPNSLPPGASNSQCVRCTACKRFCPDIDQENGYWRELTDRGRRIATFAFPGLVLAFYTYFWLRAGDWEAYFDGRWTHHLVDTALWVGPGFFFAPEVPAVAAALLTLLGFSAVSYGLFVAVEQLVGLRIEDTERRRHLVLALAAFTAFSIFYLFAGAPTLRRLPGGTRTAGFVAPLVATLFLVKRWRRTRETYIREKGASKLLRNWPFEEPPPDDPGEVYAWIKAGEHAREQQLAAYAQTLREIVHEGLVSGTELRLLEEIRKQLGITEREHEKVLARLTEEERDLLAPDRVVSVERRVQLEGYETALAEALLRHAPETEIGELQKAFGVSPEDHARVVERIRGSAGALLARAERHLAQVEGLHRDLTTLGPTTQPGARGFLAYLLAKSRDEALDRVLEVLEVAGDGPEVEELRPRLLGPDPAARKTAVGRLAAACPGAEELVATLEPLILERQPTAIEDDEPARRGAVERLAVSPDPYLRAAAAWYAVSSGDPALGELEKEAADDPDPLVREAADGRRRETAGAAARSRVEEARFSTLTAIEKMAFLRSVPLFADLDPEDLDDLSRLTREETFAPPAPLCRQGDLDDDLFILLEGQASVRLSANGDGREQETAVLEAGEVIGELSLLDGRPRSATVLPREGPIRVLRIPGADFRARLLHRRRVARPLMATLAERIRRLSLQVAGKAGK